MEYWMKLLTLIIIAWIVFIIAGMTIRIDTFAIIGLAIASSGITCILAIFYWNWQGWLS